MSLILPGIHCHVLGAPEVRTPVRDRFRPPLTEALANLPDASSQRLPTPDGGRATRRGFALRLALAEDEDLYGLGLQLRSFRQRGRKKTLRVNSDPRADLGDSHAPVPFYVSTAGYGVLVDTDRYATFYLDSAEPRPGHGAAPGADIPQTREVLVEVPGVDGVDVYVFAGPDLLTAIQRYNLFSGGGCLPPRWGLGVWYRCHKEFGQDEVKDLAAGLRADAMPCDVVGLEPGWQTHAYPCTFAWSDAFPDPGAMVRELEADGFRLNLWTHAFTHPDSPLYGDLLPLSGDYLTFGGLVPDLTLAAARDRLARQHGEAHVDLGVSGYKLDECDNSDYNARAWSFPEASRFPSGLDGEQVHCRLGLCYQEAIDGIFRDRGRRTLGQVRSSHALAAPYPFVLYSDLYGHGDFIRGVVNAGFSGLLWSPEVRHAASLADLVRRLQSVVLSPQALINAWYIRQPPWKQWAVEANNRGEVRDDADAVTAACRRILELRMALVPYLYAAFWRYRHEGVPPFRALVTEWPDDDQARQVDDAYLIGDRLLAAPLTADQESRAVYLPPGTWYDFCTGEACAAGQVREVAPPLDTVPLFVRGDALLPLAAPTGDTGEAAAFDLTVRVYGCGALGISLYEDDGVSYAYERGQYNRLDLTWDSAAGQGTARRAGDADVPAYRVAAWQPVQAGGPDA